MTNKPPVTRNMKIAQWSIPVMLLAILGISSYGPIQKQLRAAEMTSANGNIKCLYVALFSYASDHDGHFPTNLKSDSPTAAACFDKLIKAGKIDEELIFWNKKNAHTISSASTSPPNEVSPLTENENTTGYVMGLTTRSPTNIPILFDSSTEAGTFNTSVWEGRVIIAKLNGSVAHMTISEINEFQNIQNKGYILEKRGGEVVDIFQDLPEGTKILPPQIAQ
jgi:hypothetical protein